KKFSCPGPLRFFEQVYNGSMPSFVLNPHAWTKIASVIFLDQPVNTGFSYATNSAAYKYTNVQACEYVYEFLRKWLSDHPQFISNPFYISGNSFAGMIVPVIAQYISNGNAAGKEPLINLQGYLLGNPAAFLGEFNYRIPFSLGMGLIPDELYKIQKHELQNISSIPVSAVRVNSEPSSFEDMTITLLSH
ncbi:Serine carboxypeptidase-like 12, partial [Capsicum annuum]